MYISKLCLFLPSCTCIIEIISWQLCAIYLRQPLVVVVVVMVAMVVVLFVFEALCNMRHI